MTCGRTRKIDHRGRERFLTRSTRAPVIGIREQRLLEATSIVRSSVAVRCGCCSAISLLSAASRWARHANGVEVYSRQDVKNVQYFVTKSEHCRLCRPAATRSSKWTRSPRRR